MRTIVFSVAFGVLTAGMSQAASPLDWSGFYVGGQLGAANIGGTLRSLSSCSGSGNCVSEFSAAQALLGGFVGYRLSLDHTVVGIEVDANLKFGEATSLLQGFSSYQGDWMTGSSWDSSTRLSLGFVATDKLMVFTTAGIAISSFSLDNANCSGCADWGTQNLHGNVRLGWIAGMGAEVEIGEGWNLRGQYLHADYGVVTVQSSTGKSYSSQLATDTVTVGLSSQFN